MTTFRQKTGNQPGSANRLHNTSVTDYATYYAAGYAENESWGKWQKTGDLLLTAHSFPHSPQVFPQAGSVETLGWQYAFWFT